MSMRRGRRLALAWIGVAVTGCTAADTTTQARMFEAPRAVVWQAVTAALQETAYRPASMHEAQGVAIGERSYSEPSVISLTADAEHSVHARWWGMDATLIVGVEERPGGRSRVTVGSKLMGWTNPSMPASEHGSPTAQPLRSNGTIERDVLDHIAAHLASADSQPRAATSFARPP